MVSVPTIDSFDGIKINIYYGDHLPPHVHGVYGEYEALVVIRAATVYAGSLPAKQLKAVKAWVRDNRAEALEIFFAFNPTLQ